jgi:hypothetical protein
LAQKVAEGQTALLIGLNFRFFTRRFPVSDPSFAALLTNLHRYS